MQPFTIPTSSLEKTLLVGDFLFVSKFHYGARTPMTAVSFPMVHDTVPVLHKKSYLLNPQLPYFRIPGFQDIKRNDIVVFNWPVDTLIDINNPAKGFKIKPLDKKSNYVKRCVGIPGDSLEIIDGYVYINGKQNELPDRARLQFSYFVKTNGTLNPQLLKDRYDITDRYNYNRENSVYGFAAISDESVALLKKNPKVIEIIKIENEKGKWNRGVFPHDPRFPWNTKFFGPLYIPQQGATIAITIENIPLYKRVIEVYEGSEIGINNKITQSGTQVFLNGNLITEYTFLQDYYWMMGDNRDNSQDARMWGFVPFNHVVGKPVFVWMSFDSNAQGWDKIRTDRLFTTVGGDGELVSYFKYFVILLGAWFAFDFFRKRKKKA
jgi:signal peptidase I